MNPTLFKKITEPYPIFVFKKLVDISSFSIKNFSMEHTNSNKTLHTKFVNKTCEIFDDTIKSLLFDLLNSMKPLENKFNFKVPKKLDYFAILMRSLKGYELLPHNDRRDSIISGILYLDCEPNKGGQLIFCDCKKTTTAPHLAEKEYEDLLEVTPEPGTFVCWLNSYNSYHYVKRFEGSLRESIYFGMLSRERIWF